MRWINRRRIKGRRYYDRRRENESRKDKIILHLVPTEK
jgi:hypothetical protein